MHVSHLSLCTAVVLAALSLPQLGSDIQDPGVVAPEEAARVVPGATSALSQGRTRLAVLGRVLRGQELTNDQRGMEITEFLQEVVRVGLEGPRDGQVYELPEGRLARDAIEIVRTAAANLMSSGDTLGAVACEALAELYQSEAELRSPTVRATEGVTPFVLSSNATGPETLRVASEVLQEICFYARKHGQSELRPRELARLSIYCWNRADELEGLEQIRANERSRLRTRISELEKRIAELEARIK